MDGQRVTIVCQCPIIGYETERGRIAAADFHAAGEGVFVSAGFEQAGFVAFSRFLRDAVENKRIMAQAALRVEVIAVVGERLLLVSGGSEIEHREKAVLCDDELADIVVVVRFMVVASFHRDKETITFHKQLLCLWIDVERPSGK